MRRGRAGCRTYGAFAIFCFAFPALTDRANLWRTYGALVFFCFAFPALTDRANLWRTYGALVFFCFAFPALTTGLTYVAGREEYDETICSVLTPYL
jgi:hypothetical protein